MSVLSLFDRLLLYEFNERLKAFTQSSRIKVWTFYLRHITPPSLSPRQWIQRAKSVVSPTVYSHFVKEFGNSSFYPTFSLLIGQLNLRHLLQNPPRHFPPDPFLLGYHPSFVNSLEQFSTLSWVVSVTFTFVLLPLFKFSTVSLCYWPRTEPHHYQILFIERSKDWTFKDRGQQRIEHRRNEVRRRPECTRRRTHRDRFKGRILWSLFRSPGSDHWSRID